MNSPTGHFVPFLLLVLVTVLVVHGQDLDDVTISGKIVDSNGLAIVGAAIAATHAAKHLIRTTLQGDVKMRQQSVRARRKRNDLIGQQIRLD